MRYQIFTDAPYDTEVVAVPLEAAPVVLRTEAGTLFPRDVVEAGSPGEAVFRFCDQGY